MYQKILCGLSVAIFISACATTPPSTTETGSEPETTQANATVATNDDEIRKKYEQIQYGQELDFVCTNPVPAEGHLSERPNLQVMWENYLYDRPEGIWGEIGGMVEVNGNLPLDQGRWTNACTVRLSHMLNKAGHKIKRQSDNKSVSGGVSPDGQKDQYIYRLRDLESYLVSVWGEPDLAINDGSADTFSLPARPGLLVMDFPGSTFNGHTTIWNGAGSVDNADIGGHRVLMWDLPCFMPKDRQTQAVAMMGTKERSTLP